MMMSSVMLSVFVKLFSQIETIFTGSYFYLFSKSGEFNPSVLGVTLLYQDYVILQL